MKKLTAMLLTLVVVAGMTACHPSSQTSQTLPPTQATPPTQQTGPIENLVTADAFGTYENEIVSKVTAVMKLPSDGDFGVAQGACSDGKYIYTVLENQNVNAEGGYSNNPHYCKIFKIDPTTQETLKISEPLLIDHGNDITFNPQTGMLIVCHNAPNRTHVSFIDPDTLELVQTATGNELEMYAIAYNATRGKYVVGISHGYDFAILDSELNVETRFTGQVTNWTKQGIECDDNYIYFLQHNTDAVVVYDWDGNYIRTVKITWVYNEPEAIFLMGGKFYMTTYIGTNSGAQLLEMRFIGKK